MSTFFTPRSIEQYYPVMLAAAEATAQRWETFARERRPIDMTDEMTRITAWIILRSMFGTDISEERLRLLEGDVERMILFVNQHEMLPLKLPLWAPLPRNVRYRGARARVHTLIREVIARRRAESPGRGSAWATTSLRSKRTYSRLCLRVGSAPASSRVTDRRSTREAR
jgi:cytochrome P450